MSEITWTCDKCEKPILDTKGGVFLPDGAVETYREARSDWDELHPPGEGIMLSDLEHAPQPAEWIVSHYACEADGGKSGYGLDVSQIRVPQNVVYWTRHMMGKSWFLHSDWDRILNTSLEYFPATASAHSY